MQDKELTEKIINDPDGGMGDLIDAYSGIVYSVVRSVLSPKSFCEADMEDCVSEVFSEFYLGLKKYDHTVGSIKSYLCVIAKRRAIDYLRKHGKARADIPIDDVGDVFDTSFDDSIELADIILAIKKLAAVDSEIIVRKFYLSQSSKLIAEKMGMSVSAVDTRTHRALLKLRNILGGEKL